MAKPSQRLVDKCVWERQESGVRKGEPCVCERETWVGRGWSKAKRCVCVRERELERVRERLSDQQTNE
jgi:hypothetical protein